MNCDDVGMEICTDINCKCKACEFYLLEECKLCPVYGCIKHEAELK